MSYGALTFTFSSGATAVLDLPTPDVILGRGDDADIQIADDVVSKRHLRLTINEQGVWLMDLDSTNGTFFGEQRLPPGESVLWPPDQPVNLGETTIVYTPDPLVVQQPSIAGDLSQPTEPWRRPAVIVVAVLLVIALCTLIGVMGWWLSGRSAEPPAEAETPAPTMELPTAPLLLAPPLTAEPSPSPSPSLAVTQSATPPTTALATCEATMTVTAVFGVNVRRGPGTQYAIAVSLPQGSTAPIDGQTENGSWWRISLERPGSPDFWVSDDVVETACTADVPIVATPPPPTATPTATPTQTPTSTPTPTATPTPTPTGPPDTRPPAVSVLTAPASPRANEAITFTVLAADEGTVARIELWIQAPGATELVRVLVCEAVTTCQYVGGPYPTGTLQYRAFAWDGANNQGGTAVLNLAILPVP